MPWVSFRLPWHILTMYICMAESRNGYASTYLCKRLRFARRTGHPKNAGAMDCFPATFLQSHYCIVYSGIYPRHPQNAQAKNAEKSDEKKSWPNLEFDRVKNCVGRGVHSLQVNVFPCQFNNVPNSRLLLNKHKFYAFWFC